MLLVLALVVGLATVPFVGVFVVDEWLRLLS
jgi:hypothetical protein